MDSNPQSRPSGAVVPSTAINWHQPRPKCIVRQSASRNKPALSARLPTPVFRYQGLHSERTDHSLSFLPLNFFSRFCVCGCGCDNWSLRKPIHPTTFPGLAPPIRGHQAQTNRVAAVVPAKSKYKSGPGLLLRKWALFQTQRIRLHRRMPSPRCRPLRP